MTMPTMALATQAAFKSLRAATRLRKATGPDSRMRRMLTTTRFYNNHRKLSMVLKATALIPPYHTPGKPGVPLISNPSLFDEFEAVRRTFQYVEPHILAANNRFNFVLSANNCVKATLKPHRVPTHEG